MVGQPNALVKYHKPYRAQTFTHAPDDDDNNKNNNNNGKKYFTFPNIDNDERSE